MTILATVLRPVQPETLNSKSYNVLQALQISHGCRSESRPIYETIKHDRSKKGRSNVVYTGSKAFYTPKN